ncbi:6,7-dimethyl-8-ribityllumazine synthase [Candidatus Peregrinibacteria bacterium CG10_big_fil_rev_8_21_14_0_10_49_10]|nr:MAG: 6,7-dimethyl-8-ribityllumazine synthase [Candidatus Peregrinibacteria bacterium CG10_big_fil_rev_8_21_14_0_10_49_10]
MKNAQSHPGPAYTVNPQWRVGIVASSFYKEERDAMVEGAQSVFAEAGMAQKNITVHYAAGSFEVPLIGCALAEAGKVDALLGLGIILQGETHHAELLAEQAARGIMDVQLRFGIPFAFEVLFAQDMDLLKERVFGEKNKGKEAAHAVLHSLAKLQSIRSR